MNDEQILDAILLREGGFVDHPADKGGPTNFGVTQATLAFWRGHPVTVSDVRTMGPDEARAIYREKYLNKPGLFLVLDDRLRAFLVDCAVNHGPLNAVKFLQRSLGVVDDGVMGPVTLDALKAAQALSVYLKACAERVEFYGRIIAHDHTQAIFAAGWAKRAADFIREAA